jgi:hypothetical protein
MPRLFPLLQKHNTISFTLSSLFHGILLFYCSAYSSTQKMGPYVNLNPSAHPEHKALHPKITYSS